MSCLKDIFVKLDFYIKEDIPKHFTDATEHISVTAAVVQSLRDIITNIDELAYNLQSDDTILISVKHQKLLRTCFEIITCLGISKSLIPGLGISLNKKCSTFEVLPTMQMDDEEKYCLLVECTDFFIRSYSIPILKSIILTLHLSDYLAALIQLSFAPLKKPGVYEKYVMTVIRYDELLSDRHKYTAQYNDLVKYCFQPLLMKELLILNSVKDPPVPNFVKKVVTSEMSKRLLAPEGLLSLIRCFIESFGIDTGIDWKKIEMICKIISVKHGTVSESDYLTNICQQLDNILLLNNPHYLITAAACISSLNKSYPECDKVNRLRNRIFENFYITQLNSKSTLPGTIIMTTQEIEQNVELLHASVCSTKMDWSSNLLFPNLFVVFLLGASCDKSEELKQKIKAIVIKCLEGKMDRKMISTIQTLLFGLSNPCYISIQEFESGLIIKSSNNNVGYPQDPALKFLIDVLKSSTSTDLISKTFESCLQLLINITSKRKQKLNQELLSIEEEPELSYDIDIQYATVLQLLTELSMFPKTLSRLKYDSNCIIDFVESIISNNATKDNDECLTIALVLLNTILSNVSKDNLQNKLKGLIPFLKRIEGDDLSYNSILCKEALTMIVEKGPNITNTACSIAIGNIYDKLLPVRAHGIIELTKLIDAKDPETIAKKHYIFCLLQEQLKDTDSYIYLAAINGIAALGAYCTEDVLHVLSKEFINMPTETESINTNKEQARKAEERMKVGDIIVKVTRQLGEMALVHKTILLNTILCGCRDDDPLIRMSALSNLAEIALVMNYKMGTIIYEVLLCVWSTVESDKAVECRRAAVMVISSLIKGVGKETLVELKDHLLPIYRALKKLYHDDGEDSVLRLHAQMALEELNEVVTECLFPKLSDIKIKLQI